jgi:hypothetical protein
VSFGLGTTALIPRRGCQWQRDQACQRIVVPATRPCAEVPDFLRLINNLGESYAPSSDQFRARADQGGYPRYGSVGFSGVADGSLAGAGDDCHLLAGDAP